MYCDARMLGEPVWYISPPPDAEMRVPNLVHDCVVFLGTISAGRKSLQRSYHGTGFWVAHRNEPRGTGESVYLVTAAHVARGLEDRRWFLRMNGPDGLAVEVKGTPTDRWHYHLDPTVDAAVLPLAPKSV